MSKVILQEGNYVKADSKGGRTSVPMSQRPDNTPKRREKSGAMGLKNPANEKSVEAAGMKDGGLVRSTPKSTKYTCK
jgi:hypothetical protein